AAGGTLALAGTANLRRRVRERLAEPVVDERFRVEHIRVCRAASEFERDWAYLQHARQRLPATYRAGLERWRGWFIHCDAEMPFPRFVRGCDLAALPAGGDCFGPLPDTRAAQGVIDAVEDLFDLCRYHHILMEAPHGRACAYKEMGRCPAPCDGTIGMDRYRAMVRDALSFLAAPADKRATIERAMQTAASELDFERATVLRRRWERAAAFERPACRHLRRLGDFRFAFVANGERRRSARVFLVVGGWITPWVDVPEAIDGGAVSSLLATLDDAARTCPIDREPAALENMGLACWHMFRDDAALSFVRLGSADAASRLGPAIEAVQTAASVEPP
ncbi:MAG: UvrB/UvrC motif-containing protein, partial [Phycisphaerae bacterium]|nr:UvrB/UvrC motif-containing protein [Phycisphaerae bacterium]